MRCARIARCRGAWEIDARWRSEHTQCTAGTGSARTPSEVDRALHRALCIAALVLCAKHPARIRRRRAVAHCGQKRWRKHGAEQGAGQGGDTVRTTRSTQGHRLDPPMAMVWLLFACAGMAGCRQLAMAPSCGSPMGTAECQQVTTCCLLHPAFLEGQRENRRRGTVEIASVGPFLPRCSCAWVRVAALCTGAHFGCMLEPCPTSDRAGCQIGVPRGVREAAAKWLHRKLTMYPMHRSHTHHCSIPACLLSAPRPSSAG